MTNEDLEILDRLAKAGAIVGSSNREWWLDLEVKYGEELLLGVITSERAKIRQPVSVAVVQKLAEKEAQRRQDECDDAAEDAAAESGIAPSPKVGQSAKGTAAAVKESTGPAAAAVGPQPIPSTNAAPAAVNTGSSSSSVDRVSTAPTTVAGDAAPSRHREPIDQSRTAAIERPWGLTKPTTQENDMATIKQLVSKVEAEIKRRGIHASEAMKEIGVAATAIYAWRKGQCSEKMHGKISIWLLESEKKSAAAPEGDGDEAPAQRAPRAKSSKERDATGEIESDDLSTEDLIERSEAHAELLDRIGATDMATNVRALCARIKRIRQQIAALSA